MKEVHLLHRNGPRALVSDQRGAGGLGLGWECPQVSGRSKENVWKIIRQQTRSPKENSGGSAAAHAAVSHLALWALLRASSSEHMCINCRIYSPCLACLGPFFFFFFFLVSHADMRIQLVRDNYNYLNFNQYLIY